MPNAKMFFLHGTLLIAYLAFYLAYVTIFVICNTNDRSNEPVLEGVGNIFGSLCALFECIGYWMVLLLMMPLTSSQRTRREDFQAFMLYGY